MTGRFSTVLKSIQALDSPASDARIVLPPVDPEDENDEIVVTSSPFGNEKQPFPPEDRQSINASSRSSPQITRGMARLSVSSDDRTSRSSVSGYSSTSNSSTLTAAPRNPFVTPTKIGSASDGRRQLRENPKPAQYPGYISNPSPSVLGSTGYSPLQPSTPHRSPGAEEFEPSSNDYWYAIKPESITNVCAIEFLGALLDHNKRYQKQWNYQQNDFRFIGPKDKIDMSYTARTDGHMATTKGDMVFAIIEVKPRLGLKATTIQQKLFITVGTYKDEYLKFLRGEDFDKRVQDSFLVMTQYGPWNLKIPSDMEEVGPILLALSMVSSPKTYDHLKVPS
ncbi:MAG: hypothetical protein MMC33_004845 [Icmadophila ericetorum]|nr:hypothetical protein [Icmadophila ericetorum]